jgi:16S rRNA (cytidine1402-2'-O)-methyltransferase
MGTLYIVPTPIGNLADITLRALKVLFSVQVVACEDTRRTGMLLEKLLKEFSTNPEEKQKPRFLSYYDQNELQRIPEIINLLKSEQDVALVSDAGTPAISDPGFKLVRECLKEKIRVVPLPGASSVLTALTASGLPTDKFMFVGYPPHKPGHRLTYFENIKTSLESVNGTVVMFEAPHKVIKTLQDMEKVFGEDTEIVFARELTKIYEEIKRRKIHEAIIHFKKKEPKGEFVLLFHL